MLVHTNHNFSILSPSRNQSPSSFCILSRWFSDTLIPCTSPAPFLSVEMGLTHSSSHSFTHYSFPLLGTLIRSWLSSSRVQIRSLCWSHQTVTNLFYNCPIVSDFISFQNSLEAIGTKRLFECR